MLQSVKILHYKNYKETACVFTQKFNLINGENGSGKTNLVDAIYYLCMCKSYFTRSDSDAVLKGSDFFRLEGVFDVDSEHSEIICKYMDARKKEFLRNKIVYTKLSDHIGRYPVVMIAPGDIDIVVRTSEERRRFLDITLAQINKEYLDNLMRYNKVLLQRNALLKQLNEGSGSDRVLLNVLNAQLTKSGTAVHLERNSLLERFIPTFNKLFGLISMHYDTPSIHYQSQLTGVDFGKLLIETEAMDIHGQRTTQGIHRDDLVFTLNNMPLKETASQGQLKSFLISLKLTQYHLIAEQTGTRPLLLLDDIFEKLDKKRLEALFLLLNTEIFTQIFITDADTERSNKILQELEIKYAQFTVCNGQIS